SEEAPKRVLRPRAARETVAGEPSSPVRTEAAGDRQRAPADPGGSTAQPAVADPFGEQLRALEDPSNAPAFPELALEVVARATRLSDLKERDAIRNLATASAAARDLEGMRRTVKRLLRAEEHERAAD